MLFNKIHSLVMVWNECNSDEDIEFKKFSDLDQYIKKCYPLGSRDLPSNGYDKFKISLSMTCENGIIIPLYIGGLSRIDIAIDDYDPFTTDFKSELIKIYSKKDFKVSYGDDKIVFDLDFSDIA